MANPIEQFEIKTIQALEIPGTGIDISFTNSSLMIVISVALCAIVFGMVAGRMSEIPSRLQAFAEGIYEFVANMVKDNIGPKGHIYFPLVFSLFTLIATGNLLGLVPGAFTFTSHLAVTAALALIVFFVVLVMGFIRHGMHFLSLFAPPGVPMLIMPLIIPIEIVSFLSRPLTHALRLFINMMAGHMILKVFAGFSVAMVSAGVLGAVGSMIPMLVNSAIVGFEIFIALVQAYVFALLTCIYLKDTIEIDH